MFLKKLRRISYISVLGMFQNLKNVLDRNRYDKVVLKLVEAH